MENDRLPRGVAGLRAKLAAEHNNFAVADQFETKIEEICSEVKARLKDARKSLGVDQVTLAEKMQVGQPMISRIENGAGDIGIKTLYRYLKALGLTFSLDIQLEPDATHLVLPGATVTSATATAVEEALENVDKARELLLAASEQLAAAE